MFFMNRMKSVILAWVVIANFCCCLSLAVDRKTVGQFDFNNLTYTIFSVDPGATGDAAVIISRNDSTIYLLKRFTEVDKWYLNDSLLTLQLKVNESKTTTVSINLREELHSLPKIIN